MKKCVEHQLNTSGWKVVSMKTICRWRVFEDSIFPNEVVQLIDSFYSSSIAIDNQVLFFTLSSVYSSKNLFHSFVDDEVKSALKLC